MRNRIILYYNDIVFTPSESFLHKDFGQVPFVISELTGANLEYWIATSYPNRGFEFFRGKRVRQFAKNLRMLPSKFDILKNLLLYKAIGRGVAPTHLILFPFTPLTDIMVAHRARRRGAKIIVKLDTNRAYLETLAADWRRIRRSPARVLRQCYHYRKLLDMADLVLCETSECEDILTSDFLDVDLRGRLAKTFSGLSETWLESIGIKPVLEHQRRSSIMVSGRISSWQKNTALILEAGPPPEGWMIEFIGEVDQDLKNIIDTYRATDPNFDEHYRFYGAISDKRAYFDILLRGRALLMNSRGGEGFPNVFAEAHFGRLFIVTSDVSGAADATGGARWGIVYPCDDAVALRAALQALPERIVADAVPEPYRRRFIWEDSLDQPVIRRLFEKVDGAPGNAIR